MKHVCNVCNYSTHEASKLRRHNQTVKHRNKISKLRNLRGVCEKGGDEKRLVVDDTVVCKYCDKVITHSKNMSRHYKSCKVKKEQTVIQTRQLLTDQLTIKCKEQENKIVDLTNKCEEYENKIVKLEDRIVELTNFLQQNLSKSLDNNGNSVTNNTANITNNNITITPHYIRKNWTDVPSFDEIMEASLTKKEIKDIIKAGPGMAPAKLIIERCIKGVAPDQRSIHCINQTKNNYMYMDKGGWKEDVDANHIITKSLNKTAPVYNAQTDKMREDPNHDQNKVHARMKEASIFRNMKALTKNFRNNVNICISNITAADFSTNKKTVDNDKATVTEVSDKSKSDKNPKSKMDNATKMKLKRAYRKKKEKLHNLFTDSENSYTEDHTEDHIYDNQTKDYHLSDELVSYSDELVSYEDSLPDDGEELYQNNRSSSSSSSSTHHSK